MNYQLATNANLTPLKMESRRPTIALDNIGLLGKEVGHTIGVLGLAHRKVCSGRRPLERQETPFRSTV